MGAPRALAIACSLNALLLVGCIDDPITDPNPTIRLLDARLAYATGGHPFEALVHDLSQNGRKDLITIHPNDNTLAVLLARESGGYEAPQIYETGDTPTTLAVGDFNGDGIPDVVVANGASGDLSFFLGQGGGLLDGERRLPLLLNAEPVAMVVADFNGDGALDIAVSDTRRNSISLLFGLGDGAFFEEIFEMETQPGPRSLAAGDLTGSGHLDLVVAERETNTVSVYYGNGLGNFSAPQSFTTGVNPRKVEIADVNGNGLPDLVTTNPGSREIMVHANGGGGIFLDPVSTVLPLTPTRFALGDFDKDGRIDVAIVVFGTGNDPQPLGQMMLLKGTGNGAFIGARHYGIGSGALDVLAADFENNGNLDLLSVDTGAQTLSILRNRGNGSFRAEERFAAGQRPRAIATADFNGDGRTDLAVVNLDSQDISILLGQGDGTFLPQQKVAMTGFPRAIAVGRINGDNHTDMVVTSLSGNQASVFLGRGDGTFQSERIVNIRRSGETRASQPRSVALADMNKDGNADLVVGNAGTDTVAILFGDGNGNFGAPEEFFVGNFPLSVAVSDLNRDGALDVIVVNGNDPQAAGGSPGRVSTVYGNGEGGLDVSTRRAVATGNNPRDMILLDLDGDGNLDAATVELNEDRVYIHNGQGATIAPGNSTRTGRNPNTLTAARLSTILLPDIITTNEDNTVSVLRNLGMRNFAPPLNYPAGDGPIGPVTADLNGNGIPDLIFCNRNTGNISVILGRR